MKIPFASETKVKEWGEITSRTSWTATENCYLNFTSVSNDTNGYAYVTINDKKVAGCLNGSVSTGWVLRYAHSILVAKGDKVEFVVSGGKNKLDSVSAYKIEWK